MLASTAAKSTAEESSGRKRPKPNDDLEQKNLYESEFKKRICVEIDGSAQLED